mmetsp:Transcript_111737/g.316354  ORF Transcript_111737/g.316354 Transcript_111737/m.316354 type:complete len:493 (+) Transcript_111737:1-1479(+)
MGFVCLLRGGGQLALYVPAEKDFKRWLDAFEVVVREASPHIDDGESGGALGSSCTFVDAAAQAGSGGAAAGAVGTPRVREGPGRLASTVIHEGALTFQHDGASIRRYGLLYDDRLDTWGRVPGPARGTAEPEDRIFLADVTGFEVVTGGFTLNCMNRRISVQADSNEDLRTWSCAMLSVIVPGPPLLVPPDGGSQHGSNKSHDGPQQGQTARHDGRQHGGQQQGPSAPHGGHQPDGHPHGRNRTGSRGRTRRSGSISRRWTAGTVGLTRARPTISGSDLKMPFGRQSLRCVQKAQPHAPRPKQAGWVPRVATLGAPQRKRSTKRTSARHYFPSPTPWRHINTNADGNEAKATIYEKHVGRAPRAVLRDPTEGTAAPRTQVLAGPRSVTVKITEHSRSPSPHRELGACKWKKINHPDSGVEGCIVRKNNNVEVITGKVTEASDRGRCMSPRRGPLTSKITDYGRRERISSLDRGGSQAVSGKITDTGRIAMAS